MVLRALGLLFAVSSVVLFLYNFTLALVSLACRRAVPQKAAQDLRFAIVVPAHNEERTIAATLHSCQAIDYPADNYDVFVIADNCTDDTAGVVSSHGIHCLVRQDPTRRGKGYALRWAFDQLLPKGYDAFVVLDADCRIDAYSLNVFADEIASRQAVLQANNVVSNPDDSAISYAVAVGNAMENHLYYRPKSELGLMVLLRGTGMVFRREVLERYPWGAFSIVEDMDYSISLYKNGLKVKFLSDVAVRSPAPGDSEQLAAQRSRWAGGNVQLGKAGALKLLTEGIGKGKAIYVDMALTIVSQSKPLQLISVAALYLVSTLGILLSRDRFFDGLFGLSNVLVIGYAAYILWGILDLGLSRRRLELLLQTPPVLARLAVTALRSVVRGSDAAWERTPRE
ncbi:MAG: glycosyltransferase [Candidatus Latescibacterota bacterium]|nr:MAG: glycosyltransferase [Candidatus Latescibacterota bacterium]